MARDFSARPRISERKVAGALAVHRRYRKGHSSSACKSAVACKSSCNSGQNANAKRERPAQELRPTRVGNYLEREAAEEEGEKEAEKADTLSAAADTENYFDQ